VELAAKHVMSEGIGGDLYDFVLAPNGCYSLVIGDVVGHELFSALVMSLIFGAVHTAGPKAAAPVEILALINELLCDLNDQMRSPTLMCSLFYGTVHPTQRHMVYANAGHPAPLIWSHSRQVEELKPTCPVLGVSREVELSETTLSLEGVRRLLLYTDGITEARNDAGHFFGTANIMEALSSCELSSPKALLNRLFERILSWTNNRPSDDATAILAEFGTDAI
jgi:sigma-B regulation protein RsbU (phosphoserine phosphatase)